MADLMLVGAEQQSEDFSRKDFVVNSSQTPLRNDWRGWHFVCAHCGAPDPVGYKTEDALLWIAKANGWKIEQDDKGEITDAACALCVELGR